LVYINHLTLLENNPQGLCYCKNRGTCKMRVVGCGQVPMYNVPEKVWGHAVLFAVADLFIVFGCQYW